MALYYTTYLQQTGLTVELISVEVGCLGHFMPETLTQVATACCVSKKALRGHYLSRQLVLPSPELPVSGIYWTCYPELFFFLLTCNFVM